MDACVDGCVGGGREGQAWRLDGHMDRWMDDACNLSNPPRPPLFPLFSRQVFGARGMNFPSQCAAPTQPQLPPPFFPGNEVRARVEVPRPGARGVDMLAAARSCACAPTHGFCIKVQLLSCALRLFCLQKE
eukprot:362475-Chlamydomonas_euryale.AAC.4